MPITIVSNLRKNAAIPICARISLLDTLHLLFPIQLDALPYTLNRLSTRMAKPATVRAAPEIIILIPLFFKLIPNYAISLTLVRQIDSRWYHLVACIVTIYDKLVDLGFVITAKRYRYLH